MLVLYIFNTNSLELGVFYEMFVSMTVHDTWTKDARTYMTLEIVHSNLEFKTVPLMVKKTFNIMTLIWNANIS